MLLKEKIQPSTFGRAGTAAHFGTGCSTMNNEFPNNHSLTCSRILIVDEDPGIRHLLHISLGKQDYRVYDIQSVNAVFKALHQYRPDVLIMDPGRADSAGITVIAAIRAKWHLLPIVVLSEQANGSSTVRMLDAGADDYLTKPFGLEEMSARIRAAMRRSVASNAALIVGDLAVDLTRRSVIRNQQTVHLTPVEYELLKALMARIDEVLTPAQLAAELWEDQPPDKVRRLRVHMSNLRAKLEADPEHPRLILTEPGVGYRLSSANRAHVSVS
jgi:two-component system, OmpR family, KDP operon response regulator KdpE